MRVLHEKKKYTYQDYCQLPDEVRAEVLDGERKSILTEANVQGAPDLVIEILSSGDKKRDTVKKKAIYEKYGVKEYWIVDPDTETISVFILEEKVFQHRGIYNRNQILKSPLLPDFSLILEDVFKSNE